MDEEANANNHHSIAEYKGHWILFYHRWLVTPSSAWEKKQRHVAAEYIHFNADGTIKKVERSKEGVSDFPARTNIAEKKTDFN